MCDSSTGLSASRGFQGGSGLFQAYSQYKSGQMQQTYYSNLADTSRQNASLALAAGESNKKAVGYQESQEERRLGMGLRETVGAQTAGLATGAGVGSKTAEQVVSDTLNKGNLDEIALRYNSALKQHSIDVAAKGEAYSDLNQAGQLQLASENAMTAAKIGMVGTILGTGGSVAQSYYMPYYGYGARG